jgi:WD40 repeat protein
MLPIEPLLSTSSTADSAVWRKARSAVCRISVRASKTAESRGTAFLVAPDLVITALHVIADRTPVAPRFYASEYSLDFPWGTVAGAVVSEAFNHSEDWAVLRLSSVAPVQPLPLGSPESLGEGSHGADVDIYGFPDSDPFRGKAGVGKLRRYEPGDADSVGAFLQLFCEDAAAGNGEPVRGLSGGPVLVDGAVVGLLRTALLDSEERSVAGTLYACPISSIIDSASTAKLGLPAADPLRGLPGIPRKDLPPSPYRDLQPYGTSDAAIFFGRAKEIRDLYERLTAEEASPIILLYGQSGVGKSSLLEAGVFPRLVWSREVRSARRNAAVGLARTLSGLFNLTDSAEPKLISDAWRTAEQANAQPIVAWLDQVDEVWTRPMTGSGSDPASEIAGLLNLCVHLFATPKYRPQGKLLISFRKDFLPEIETAFTALQLPFARFFLEPMGRASVEQVVLGPTYSRRLRMQYSLSVEPGVEKSITERICADPRSPVAPSLQIFMTRLWDAAKKENEASPLFSRDLLSTIERVDDYLADFLDRQLAVVGTKHTEAEESGLLLDLLAYHTTSMATADERNRSEIAAEYNHVPMPILDSILADFISCRLLTDAGDRTHILTEDRKTRLVHDTLGPRVRARYEQSQKPGQRARRILDARVRSSSSRVAQSRSGPIDPPAPLAPSDLALVRSGYAGMRTLSPEQKAIVVATEKAETASIAERKSRRAEQQAAEAAVATAQRHTRNSLVVFGCVALVAAIVAGILWRKARQDAERRAERLAESMFQTSQAASGNGDFTHALLGIAKAVEAAPATWRRRPIYIARAAHISALRASRVVPLGDQLERASFSKDGKVVLVNRQTGEFLLQNALDGSLLRELLSPAQHATPTHVLLPFSIAISPNAKFAAALLPSAKQAEGSTVVGWDCDTGVEWLRAQVPQDIAVDPRSVILSVDDSGSLVARVEALGFDLGGGLPYATSSAMMHVWRRGEGGLAMTPPAVSLAGSATKGEFAPDPSGRSRVVFFPELQIKNPKQHGPGKLSIFDLVTGETKELSEKLPGKGLEWVAWAVDGSFVVVGSVRDKDERKFDVDVFDINKAPSWRYTVDVESEKGNPQQVQVVEASSSGILLALPTRVVNRLKLVLVPLSGGRPEKSSREISTIVELTSKIRLMRLGPDGRSIVIFDASNNIRVIDLNGGQLSRPQIHVPGLIINSTIVHTSPTLVTVSRDGVLLGWDIKPESTWMDLRTGTEAPGKWLDAAAFAADLSAVALASRGQVGVVPLSDPAPLGAVERPSSWKRLEDILTGADAVRFPELRSLALGDSGDIVLAALSHIGPPRARIITSAKNTCTLDVPLLLRIDRLSFDGRRLVGCGERECTTFSARTCAEDNKGQLLPTSTISPALLGTALAASRQTTLSATGLTIDFGFGSWTASASGTSLSPVWVLADTNLEIRPPASAADGQAGILSVSPDGRLVSALVVDSRREEFGAWDVVSGQRLWTSLAPERHDVPILSAGFSRDSQWLYSLTADGRIRRHWTAGTAQAAEWLTDAAQALTGYRLVGEATLEPLDAQALSMARQRALSAARTSAKQGDEAARAILRALGDADT